MSELIFPRGGAYATFNGATISSYANWGVKDNQKLMDQTSNTRGIIAKRLTDLTGTVSISPRSSQAAGLLTQLALLGYFDPALVGTPVYGSSNLPLVVQTKDGRSLTFPKAALSKPSKLTLGPKAHLFGPCEFETLLPEAYIIGETGGYAIDASSAYTEPDIADTDEYFAPFTCTYGNGSTAIIPDKIGVIITPEVKINFIDPGMEPTRNGTFIDVSLTIEFVPLTCTTAVFYQTLAQLVGSGAAAIGGIIAGASLTFSDANGVGSGGLNLFIPNAGRIQGGVRYANDNARVETLKFQSIQQYGATANQTFFDGVSDNSTAFASATAAFVSGDAGKTITGTNIPASTTISSVTNGTTIVLSASATGGSITGETFTIVGRTLTGWQPHMIASLL